MSALPVAPVIEQLAYEEKAKLIAGSPFASILSPFSRQGFASLPRLCFNWNLGLYGFT